MYMVKQRVVCMNFTHKAWLLLYSITSIDISELCTAPRQCTYVFCVMLTVNTNYFLGVGDALCVP